MCRTGKIDDDGSGFLDLKEAKTALKGLQEAAASAHKAQEAMAAQAARQRRKASQKTHLALHRTKHQDDEDANSSPLPLDSNAPPSPGSPESPGAVSYISGIFSQRKLTYSPVAHRSSPVRHSHT